MVAIKKVAKTLPKTGLPFKSAWTSFGYLIILAKSNAPNKAERIPQIILTIMEYGAKRLPRAARPSITPAVGIGMFFIIFIKPSFVKLSIGI